MLKKLALIVLAASITVGTAHAHARHHHRIHHHYRHHRHHAAGRQSFALGGNVAAARRQGLPWCGAWMADHFGFTGTAARALWVARNWARKGVATIAHIGAVVVWPHHVGIIAGGYPGHWVIQSGNDGHAVRTRPRSIARAIALRDI